MRSLFVRNPSAYVPIALSSLALAVLLAHLARNGIVHETDEGTAAHVFQLAMVLQVPIVAFFAIKWMPRAAAAAGGILALQIGAAFVTCAAVFFLT